VSNGKTLTLQGYRAVVAEGQLATGICDTEEAAMRAAIVVQTLVDAPDATPETASAFADSRAGLQLALCWGLLRGRGWRVVPVFQ
jgi:hypothetical protein